MQKKQFGRSMIEMLGVLAIIGVLSIGGILGYRRAVNNHQANQILDDVNRFAFVILERSGLALGEVVPKGDFKESGLYELEAFQDIEPNQFSITVSDVPRGVCEALLPKAIIEYKVRVNPSANEKGKLYDTLNTDLCLDNNFMVFYFGDTAGVCNVPDDDGPTPCTQNSDCCGDYFCAFENASSCSTEVVEGISLPSPATGICMSISSFGTGAGKDTQTINGQKFVRSSSAMNWWSADNWCRANAMKLADLGDIGCPARSCDNCCDTSGGVYSALKTAWTEGGTLLSFQ